jgi:Mrp family chromosome partitioning ATPase
VREAWRTVQVQLDRDDRRHRAVMVASASRGDGKTTAAANLALELAAGGALVIALDADLRKPDLGRVLGVRTGAASTEGEDVASPVGTPDADSSSPCRGSRRCGSSTSPSCPAPIPIASVAGCRG